jgi:phosphoserine phosphatase
MDLVIQGPGLGSEALDTFKVVSQPARIAVNGNAARCFAAADDAESRRAVRGLADYWKLDAAYVPADLRLANFRLLALDMDSTLISIECVDEIARLGGKGEEVAAITEAAMRGEIADYKESLRRRVKLLTGLDASILDRVYDERLRINDGGERLIATVRRAGLRTLLVSGGFTFFTDRLKRRLGLDYTRSNVLAIESGKLTGELVGEIVDAQGKAEALEQVSRELGCRPSQAIVFGDGANDLAMMQRAGISVAYRAKPIVQQQATYALNYSGLDAALNWFVDG